MNLRGGMVAALLLGLGLVPCRSQSVAAQTGRDVGTIALGAALGAYSGAGLALVGGLVPCDRSVSRSCIRVVTGIGAAGGLLAGALVADVDQDEIERRAVSAGYGALAGAAVGLILREAVRQYGWSDVLAAAGIGAAVGASAEGAGVGLAAGVTSGFLLWKGLGAIDASDAVALGLGGAGLGGLLGWAIATDGPGSGAGPTVTIPMRISF